MSAPSPNPLPNETYLITSRKFPVKDPEKLESTLNKMYFDIAYAINHLSKSSSSSSTSGVVLQSATTLITNYTSTGAVIPLDDTIPQRTEGTALATVSITPISETSSLFVSATIFASSFVPVGVGGNTVSIFSIFRDAATSAMTAGCFYAVNIGAGAPVTTVGRINSVSKNPTTFTLNYGTTAPGKVYINGFNPPFSPSARFFGGVLTSTFSVFELSA